MVIQIQKRFADDRRLTEENQELIGKFEVENIIVALQTLKSFEGIVKGIVYSVSEVYEQASCYPDGEYFHTKIYVCTELEDIKPPPPTSNFKRATKEDRERSNRRIRALLTKLGETCDSIDKNIYVELWKSELEAEAKTKEYTANGYICATALQL